jgi:hypothetical protein
MWLIIYGKLPAGIFNKERRLNMKDEVFMPRIFAYCKNFNTPVCSSSKNIQKDFYTKIEPLEVKEGQGYPDAGDIGKIMTKISKEYCQSCSNFSTKKGLHL